MQKQTRMTRQKKVILDVLRNTTSHPTADWVYENAKKAIPDLSLGTVYRNLKLLKDMGEILELNFGSTYSRFDGNPTPHYHFHCSQCDRIFDIDVPQNKQLNFDIERSSGFKVFDHRLEFYGICPECLKN